MKARWADVQAAYQRRADLIPNLVNTVQGYANQEKSVLVEVTQARASTSAAQIRRLNRHRSRQVCRIPGGAGQIVNGVLGRLMAISEQYPELKSNTNFLALQSQLEGTENRIEIARRDYNSAVQDYNTTLVTIPGSLWAATMYKSYKQATPFAASAGAQTAPVVNFNTGGGAPPAQQPAQPSSP